MSSPTPYDDAKAIILAANLGVPIQWQNDGSFHEPQPPTLWLSVDCTSHVLAPIELGGGVWQEEGTLYVHVMAKAGSGTDAARTLAKSVATLFRGLGPRNVVYLGGSIGAGVAEDPQGIWWVLTVTVDWRYQDVLA